jgi:hypothetical protein
MLRLLRCADPQIQRKPFEELGLRQSSGKNENQIEKRNIM